MYTELRSRDSPWRLGILFLQASLNDWIVKKIGWRKAVIDGRHACQYELPHGSRLGQKNFYPQIVLSANLEVKKVEDPAGNFDKSPIMCFASVPKVASQFHRLSESVYSLV